MVATGMATAPSKAVVLLAGARKLRSVLRSAMAAMSSQYGAQARWLSKNTQQCEQKGKTEFRRPQAATLATSRRFPQGVADPRLA